MAGCLPSSSKFEIEDNEVLRQARVLEEQVKRQTLRKREICVPSLKRQRAMAAERRLKRARISPELPIEVVNLDQTFDEDIIEQVMRPDNENVIDLDCQILVGSSDEEESESVVTVEDEEYQESLRKIKINESMVGSNSIDLLMDDDSEDEIEVLEERLVRKRGENGSKRSYKDQEPMVKIEKILGEISEQEIFSLLDSDLELCETFPPFQAIECGPILDLSSSSQDSRKGMMGESHHTSNSNKATFMESESDKNVQSQGLSLKKSESESVRQSRVDKNMFRALGRSLGSFGGEKKVS